MPPSRGSTNSPRPASFWAWASQVSAGDGAEAATAGPLDGEPSSGGSPRRWDPAAGTDQGRWQASCSGWGLTRANEAAEDVASGAWLEIARDPRRFRGDGVGFRGWTATIARTRAMDHLRKQGRRPRTSLIEQEVLNLPGRADTADAVLEAMSTRTALARFAARTLCRGRARLASRGGQEDPCTAAGRSGPPLEVDDQRLGVPRVGQSSSPDPASGKSPPRLTPQRSITSVLRHRKSMSATVDIRRARGYGFSRSRDQQSPAETNWRAAVHAVAERRTVRWWSSGARVATGRRRD
ncbi:RNA polymerase sigma factor [Streptomyces anulatus]|uniref:RNA polymerase sigma factor n=1 Tax=Streptomyces anulatus TaxID=1892 RepID=UPI00363F83CE